MKISTCQKACVVCTKYRYIYKFFWERQKFFIYLKTTQTKPRNFLGIDHRSYFSFTICEKNSKGIGRRNWFIINKHHTRLVLSCSLFFINHLNLSIHINYFGKNITLQAHHHIWENLAGSTAHCIFFRCFIWRTRNQSNDSKTGSTSGQVFNNLMFLLKTTTKHSLLLKCSFFFIEYSLYHGHWVSNHPLLSEAAASVIANTLRSSQLSNNTVTLTL